MDAGLIVAIVVGALALLGLFALLGKRARERRHEQRRLDAHETRREAEIRGARAQRSEAEAQRLEAEAREHAARAGRERRFARERQEQAQQLDPDAPERSTR